MADGERYRTEMGKKSRDKEVKIPNAWYHLPHFSVGKIASPEPARDEFQRAYFALLRLLTRQSRTTFSEWNPKQALPALGKYGEARRYDHTLRLINREAARQMQALYVAVGEIAVLAFRAGHRDGRSVLFGLAAGQVSMEELNRLTTDGETL